MHTSTLTPRYKIRTLRITSFLKRKYSSQVKNTPLENRDHSAYIQLHTGYGAAQFVEALCYKPKGRVIDSRWGRRNFSLT
jgi:hypothetical protein